VSNVALQGFIQVHLFLAGSLAKGARDFWCSQRDGELIPAT